MAYIMLVIEFMTEAKANVGVPCKILDLLTEKSNSRKNKRALGKVCKYLTGKRLFIFTYDNAKHQASYLLRSISSARTIDPITSRECCAPFGPHGAGRKRRPT